MTFLQQQNLLSRLLGDSNTDTESMWPLADRKFELNQGELLFALGSKSLLSYETGTVSSQQISLPSNFLDIHILIVDDVVLTNEYELGLQDRERYENSGEDAYFYWTNASNIRLIQFASSGTNTKTYELYYFRKSTTDLDADSDTSPLLAEYHRGPVYFAASEMLDQIGKTKLSSLNRGKFEGLMDKARMENEKRFINIQRPAPDLGNLQVFDKDVQGVGAINGC